MNKNEKVEQIIEETAEAEETKEQTEEALAC